jgi:hypothetical protein
MRVGWVSPKLCMDSFFSLCTCLMICTQDVSSVVGLSDNTVKKLQGALTGRHKNWNRVVYAMVRSNMTAVILEDKWDMNILKNMCRPPTEGNFCDKQRKAQKPVIVTDCIWHMEYIEKGNRMVNSYSINWRTWKWTKWLFLQLLDQTILTSYIILSFCGSWIDHRKFCLVLAQNLSEIISWKCLQSSPRWRPNAQSSPMMWLEGW